MFSDSAFFRSDLCLPPISFTGLSIGLFGKFLNFLFWLFILKGIFYLHFFTNPELFVKKEGRPCLFKQLGQLGNLVQLVDYVSWSLVSIGLCSCSFACVSLRVGSIGLLVYLFTKLGGFHQVI